MGSIKISNCTSHQNSPIAQKIKDPENPEVYTHTHTQWKKHQDFHQIAQKFPPKSGLCVTKKTQLICRREQDNPTQTKPM